MFAILTTSTLLAFSLAMIAVRLARRKFAYYWLIAAFGAITSWALALLMRPVAPEEIQLGVWTPQTLFPMSPALLVDSISWPFAIALVTLVLSIILTDVARASEADWISWASELALASLGIAAVLAGNPLMLLLTWAAIDLIEATILLGQVMPSRAREQIVVAYAPRLAGIVMLFAASAVAQSSGKPLVFDSISPQVSSYLLLAAGLRLGIFPLHMPFLRELPLRRGLGTLLRMVPASASLVLLARTAVTGVSPALAPFFLALTGIAAIFAAISWITADNELDGRPFWILGIASFSAAAAVRGQAAASLSWGLVAIFSGGMLFLVSARSRYLLPVVILGFMGASTLPLTQSWDAVRLYTPPISPLLILFPLAHALLLAGYLRFALKPGEPLSAAERWVQAIYPAGLTLLPLTHLLVTYWSPAGWQFPGLAVSFSALIPIGLLQIFYLLSRRGVLLPQSLIDRLHGIFTLNWLYQLLWGFYRYVGRMIRLVNVLLEGEGGILWTLLLLTILISIIAQLQLGG